METTYLTVIVVGKRPEPRKQRAWRTVARLSLLSLAAMLFARLVLLMIDLLQFQVDIAGAVTVPACAVVFIWTGWKLREWWAEYQCFKGERKCQTKRRISGRAPSAGRTSTQERRVTAKREAVAK